jgi:hypothetical protein
MQLAEWQTGSGLPMALSWLWSEGFAPEYGAFQQIHPPGSDGDRMATLICTYFETVGALYKHGLINEDLLFDWLAVSLVWDRINFEALATAHKRSTREYST